MSDQERLARLLYETEQRIAHGHVLRPWQGAGQHGRRGNQEHRRAWKLAEQLLLTKQIELVALPEPEKSLPN